MNLEEKNTNNSKYLKEEEFKKELEQQVNSALKIFEDYNKRKKEKENKEKENKEKEER